MTDLRENVGWIIGSVATVIAMSIGWLISSGVVVNVLFLLLGSGITYFVQTRTQKKAWKREYGVRIAEEVYGSLFSGIKKIILSLEEKGYWHLGFNPWTEMQDDHRYFMVDNKFRTQLDDFSEKLKNYSTAITKLRGDILPEIANEEAERVFNIRTNETINLQVKYKKKRSLASTSLDVVKCLVSQTHPKDDVSKYTSDISSIECLVNTRQTDGTMFNSHDMDKFNEFWESCLKRMKEDNTYKFVIEKSNKLLTEARSVKKEIVKRIEEPWKI